jgi:hypothetical protein
MDFWRCGKWRTGSNIELADGEQAPNGRGREQAGGGEAWPEVRLQEHIRRTQCDGYTETCLPRRSSAKRDGDGNVQLADGEQAPNGRGGGKPCWEFMA